MDTVSTARLEPGDGSSAAADGSWLGRYLEEFRRLLAEAATKTPQTFHPGQADGIKLRGYDLIDEAVEEALERRAVR